MMLSEKGLVFFIKIEDILVHSRLQWHGHVICQGNNLLMCEVMELEIEGKRKKGCPRKLCKEHTNDLVLSGLKQVDSEDCKR